MYGIKFNGKHSYDDLGYTMPPNRVIGMPVKNKVTVKIPFSNIEYDFSEIYGSQTYEQRPLKYSFNIVDMNNLTKEHMNVKRTELINWLMNSSGKQKLYDDAFPGYYFLAEAIESSFEENWKTGVITVSFTAYPFMIADLPEGNDVWDSFNFDLDVSQAVAFDVEDSESVTLLNVGTPDVVPEITSTSDMSVKMSGVTYSIPKGTIKSNDFILKSGENKLSITGEGTITFLFHKELI